MAENSWQARAMTALHDMLSERYKDDPRIFVGLDLLVYYTEGEPNHSLAPDVFVAFGVEDRDRNWYKIWEEGTVPDFVIEVASKSTAENDLGAKKKDYERLGVREYCVYDPQGGLHWPRLQLFRLVRGRYESVRGRGDPDASLALPSEVLGLELRFEEDRLKLWDPAACEYLLEYSEEKARRRAAEERECEEREGAAPGTRGAASSGSNAPEASGPIGGIRDTVSKTALGPFRANAGQVTPGATTAFRDGGRGSRLGAVSRPPNTCFHAMEPPASTRIRNRACRARPRAPPSTPVESAARNRTAPHKLRHGTGHPKRLNPARPRECPRRFSRTLPQSGARRPVR